MGPPLERREGSLTGKMMLLPFGRRRASDFN